MISLLWLLAILQSCGPLPKPAVKGKKRARVMKRPMALVQVVADGEKAQDDDSAIDGEGDGETKGDQDSENGETDGDGDDDEARPQVCKRPAASTGQ